MVCLVILPDADRALACLTLARLTLAGEGAHLVVFALEAAIVGAAARALARSSGSKHRAIWDGQPHQHAAQKVHDITHAIHAIELPYIRNEGGVHRLLQPLLALEQEQQRGLVKLSAQLERVHIVPEARGQPAPRTFGGIANLKVRIETKNVNHLGTANS
jgi:hypothetical protein